MVFINISDLIMQTILSIMETEGGEAIIKRNELAGKIGCVPSQINYVISSRFTPEQGYIIESRRGGSGFIKIIKAENTKSNKLMHIINVIGDRLDENTARVLLENLCYDNFLHREQLQLILSALPDRLYKTISREQRDKIRANIFKSMLITMNK